MAARCRCRVTGCASSLHSSYLSRWGALLPRPLVASSAPALRKREGFGGEKAATCAASLPVPTDLNISLIPLKLSRLGQCSASGKSEQKREVVFPQKSGKTTSRFCGSSFPAGRPRLCRSTVPYPAPAPCRTQGARGALSKIFFILIYNFKSSLRFVVFYPITSLVINSNMNNISCCLLYTSRCV